MLGLHCCLGYSLISMFGLLLLWSSGSRAHGFSSCKLSISRAQAQWQWSMGLAAMWHVGSSQTRVRTHVS